MTKIKDIASLLQQLAPLSYQENYDNSGLQTGDPEDEVKGVLVTLDCTLGVLDEALAAGCNLIVAHHPVIFQPLKQLTGRNEVERIIIKAIRHNLAIYACHTNLDNVLPGVNAKIAEKLGLQKIRILSPKSGNLSKLVTFVPLPDTEKVLAALHQAGAGQIGEYQNCSFRVGGTGSFQPSARANPHIGVPGQPEEVAENRLEVILPAHLKDKILTALFAAHPYEEVAYDIYRLENANQETGAGVIGYLPAPITAAEFMTYLKERMQLNIVRHTPLPHKIIHQVALCGGAGSFLIKDALHQQADAYLTADLKYHDFFIPSTQILLADIGHYESEVFTKEIFYDIVRKNFSNFAVLKSKEYTNPVRYT